MYFLKEQEIKLKFRQLCNNDKMKEFFDAYNLVEIIWDDIISDSYFLDNNYFYIFPIESNDSD